MPKVVTDLLIRMFDLHLTFCVRGTDDPKQPGFYLIKAMGSEQAGLTGVKGAMVRKVAVGRSASSQSRPYWRRNSQTV